jgi:hypothetical protein
MARGDPRHRSGLFLVAALCREWGVIPGQDEKTVWALLPAGDSTTYARAIRTAIRDAVRAVLADGGNTAAAAAAVRQITANTECTSTCGARRSAPTARSARRRPWHPSPGKTAARCGDPATARGSRRAGRGPAAGSRCGGAGVRASVSQAGPRRGWCGWPAGQRARSCSPPLPYRCCSAWIGEEQIREFVRLVAGGATAGRGRDHQREIAATIDDGMRVAAVGFALATGLSTAAVVHLLRTPNPLVDLRILRIHTYRVTAGPARCSGPSSPRSRS